MADPTAVPAPPAWLQVTEGYAPLVLSLPHSGLQIPSSLQTRLRSRFLALLDTDWWVERLYDFGAGLGATVIRTELSRTVIDLNRDPTGQSLYPGQATTGLCPLTTFDGTPLYVAGAEPDAAEIAARTERFFVPYHAALSTQLARLQARYGCVVLYDCHSIRSRVPRLFEGPLPQLNLGTHGGKSCGAALRDRVVAECAQSGHSHVVDGRFQGGYITRHYGRPQAGIHALQMELACRGYMIEPSAELSPDNWPAPYDPLLGGVLRQTLERILSACVSFALVQTRPQNC